MDAEKYALESRLSVLQNDNEKHLGARWKSSPDRVFTERKVKVKQSRYRPEVAQVVPGS